MMGQGRAIYFVTFPDGKVDEASINIYSEGQAKLGVIRSWLPERLFGSKWANQYSMVVSELWNEMKEKGFKVHTIEWPGTEP
jgi:hypothetical protein